MFRPMALMLYRSTQSFWTLFWVLVFLHQVYFGWFLVKSSFVPYVMDGNETFSVWWHAHNLYTFSFWKSFGLTDESFGWTDASHPFFHTHQGNMPRLFGFLIYALGARTIESQVLITTLVIGNLTLFFCYASIARITRPGVAFIFCFFLFSDYLLYAQWHVVTYRIWYGFLFFGTLFAISSAGIANNKWPYGILGALFFLLLYFELVFAVYVSLLCGMFALWQYWGKPRKILTIYLVQLIAGSIALALLFVQLSTALGLDVVVKDFGATFLARNASATGAAGTLGLIEFFRENNIVFWQNFRDGTSLRTVYSFVRSISTSVFQVWTPPFFLLVAAPFIGVVVSYLERTSNPEKIDLEDRKHRQFVEPSPGIKSIYPASDVLFWCAQSVALLVVLGLVIEIIKPGRIFGVEAEAARFDLWASVFAAVVVFGVSSLLLLKISLLKTLRLRPIGGLAGNGAAGVIVAALILIIFEVSLPVRSFKLVPNFGYLPVALACFATVFSLALLLFSFFRHAPSLAISRATLACSLVAILVAESHFLFDDSYADIWLPLFLEWKIRIVVKAALLLTSGAGIAIAARGARKSFGEVGARNIGAALVFLLLGISAYGAIYLLSPGYVMSGYADRLAPFAIFFLVGIPTVAVYAISFAGRRSRWGVTSICLACALAVIISLWTKIQVNYARMLPPDYLSFAKRFSSPPFVGATFAVGNYPAVVAYYAHNWAYDDQSIAAVVVDPKSPVGKRLHDTSYIWLADWKSNPAYQNTDYYVCMKTQTFNSVLALRDPSRFANRFTFCDREPIFAERTAFADRAVAGDFSPPRFWSIAKLGATRPLIHQLSTLVELRDSQWVITGEAEITHEPDQPLSSEKIELLAKPDATACESNISDLEVIQTIASGSSFKLPASFSGLVALRAQVATEVAGSDWKTGDFWIVRASSSDAPKARRCPAVLVDGGFGAGGLALRNEGWSGPEPWGTWTEGPRSSLLPVLVPDAAKQSSFLVEATVRAFVPKPERPLRVTVRANGAVVATWIFTDSEPGHVVTSAIPSSVLQGHSTLRLSFDIENPTSPLSVGQSADPRELGLGLIHLQIREMEH